MCVELNLQSGAAFHQKLADYRMTREEQAKWVVANICVKTLKI